MLVCKTKYENTSEIQKYKVVFYSSLLWKILSSYICPGHTLFFEFIFSAQFFVHHIQALLYRKFPFLFAIMGYHSI